MTLSLFSWLSLIHFIFIKALCYGCWQFYGTLRYDANFYTLWAESPERIWTYIPYFCSFVTTSLASGRRLEWVLSAIAWIRLYLPSWSTSWRRGRVRLKLTMVFRNEVLINCSFRGDTCCLSKYLEVCCLVYPVVLHLCLLFGPWVFIARGRCNWFQVLSCVRKLICIVFMPKDVLVISRLLPPSTTFSAICSSLKTP